jgi:DNA repair ATPase RecN
VQEGLEVGGAAAAACGEGGGGGAYRMTDAGLDAAEFLFAAGPEEPLRPLSTVASGGESARVMLAIKAAPAAGGGAWQGVEAAPPILVLDEIDSGVGSRLGQPIGRILRRMAGAPSSAASHDAGQRSGDGGQAATAAAAAQVSAISSQVLCVSHLPQVAAHAEHHVCVRKGADAGGRVVTRFDTLSSYEDRRQEVAAMLGLPAAAAEELMAAVGCEP